MAASVSSTSSVTNSLAAIAQSRVNAQGGRLWVTYVQCYFVTIATILGTGILGLPVTLSHSGIYPFLISFIAGFLIQALLIVFFTDLLQRAHAVQLRNVKEEGTTGESVPLNEFADDDDFDDIDIEEEHESNGPVMAGHIIIPRETSVQPPNLHLLGQLFLVCGVRQMFDVVIIIQFMAFLVSYALAGSEAYAQVIGVDHFYVIPLFVWVLTLFIVFGLQCIQPIVSLLTFAKGSLILATVFVTFFVGASIHHKVTNDFEYVGQPFLMGTVALGGVMNVMPFLYGKIQPITSQVRGFRMSVLGGLTTCAILNVLWCWAVLDIVPQTNSCFSYQVKHNNSMHQVQDDQVMHRGVCSQNLSLESAAENGEISTIPLTEIIHHLYPGYDWVALLVELFIMISITVSYLTIGAAMHHTLSGWVESLWNKDKINTYTSHLKSRVTSRCHCCSSQCVCRSFLSLLAFSVVFVVAMMNPKGFEQMLEKAASLFLNIEAGFFIFFMIQRARNSENIKLKIPLPMSHGFYHLQYIIPLYFGFAVFYDIFTTVYGFIFHGAPLPWEPALSHGIIVPIEDMPQSGLYANDSVMSYTTMESFVTESYAMENSTYV